MRSERKIFLLLSIFTLALGIFFVFSAEHAHAADTLIFHEACNTSPVGSPLPSSGSVVVGTAWNSRVELEPTATIEIESRPAWCSADSDANNQGLGYTMDPAPSTEEYYINYQWLDFGNIGNSDSIGMLLNYINPSNYYACYTEDDTTPDVIIAKVSGGTGSILVENNNQTIDSGDTLECRIDYNGGTDPTISLTNVTDTATLATWTDSSSPLTETGGAGVFCGSLPTVKTGGDCDDDLHLDEIKLWEVEVEVGITPTRILRLFEGFTIRLIDNRIILYGQ